MKHTGKLNMQDSASFVIALVIMAGAYSNHGWFENSLGDYIEASSYHVKI